METDFISNNTSCVLGLFAFFTLLLTLLKEMNWSISSTLKEGFCPIVSDLLISGTSQLVGNGENLC